MERLNGRLQTLLMALLLGLAPLQGVLAGAFSSPCQGMSMSQMGDMEAMAMDGTHGHATPVCDNCCGSDHCANGHCPACALPAIAANRTLVLPPLTALHTLAREPDIRRLLSSPLYRPPRV